MIQLAFPFKDLPGMELRDYVAAQVLPAIVTSFRGEDIESAVLTAFEYADMFLEVKEGYNIPYGVASEEE